MTRNFAYFLLGLFWVLVLATAAGVAFAGQWVAAPGLPTTICEVSNTEPDPRMGPRGLEYASALPVCRSVDTGKARLYHLDAGVMIDSQQRVAQGQPCDSWRVVLDKTIYCRVLGSTLWAVAVSAK